MEEIKLNIHVKSLADIKGNVTNVINGTDGKRFLNKEYIDLVFKIDYPLDPKKPLEVIIPKAKSIADILVPIARAYKTIIYKYPETYGVWGHCIEDLYFEGIVIKDDNTTELHLGS